MLSMVKVVDVPIVACIAEPDSEPVSEMPVKEEDLIMRLPYVFV